MTRNGAVVGTGAGGAVLGSPITSLVWLANISNPIVALIPMIGMGIAWASMTGVPSLMVVTMVPSRRIGVYLGILNMMVVVPMLIQTVTFGWIFEHLLGGKGTNAIMLAGVLLGCGAVAMLWVDAPRPDEESPIVPLGAPRRHGRSRYPGRARRRPARRTRSVT